MAKHDCLFGTKTFPAQKSALSEKAQRGVVRTLLMFLTLTVTGCTSTHHDTFSPVITTTIHLTSDPSGATVSIESHRVGSDNLPMKSEQRFVRQTPTDWTVRTNDTKSSFVHTVTVTMPGYETIVNTYDDLREIPTHKQWQLKRTAATASEKYVAFSLRAAQRQLSEASRLGGMTQIQGLVYDRQGNDVILVGRQAPDRPPLTLDDFVVALRARFLHTAWPLVSIDPTAETPKTGLQVVRYEGGIEETQFGADLFEADYRLKLIANGALPARVPGLPTYWDLAKAVSETLAGHRETRFWFYPVSPGVQVLEDVVAIPSQGVKVMLFTEGVKSNTKDVAAEQFTRAVDVAAEQFTHAFNAHFGELAREHTSLARLHGLYELVALTKALEEMEDRPLLAFWMQQYPIKPVKTRKEAQVVTRESEQSTLTGGVQLVAIATRLKDGDRTALKDAVLHTRPSQAALTWTFVVGDWLIPTSLAAAADAEAQFDLGSAYREGKGVPQDAAEAIQWWRRAAAQGHVIAQYNLGIVYSKGLGVPQDAAEAIQWWRRAAAQGFWEAQHALGDVYDEGLGVPQDAVEAVQWWRRAATQGHGQAQLRLGNSYVNGHGVARDDVEAVQWWRRAATQGYAQAQLNLGGMYFQGRGVARDAAEAVQWWRRAATQGYAQAQYNLGVLYDEGKALPQDNVEAYFWFTLAAQRLPPGETRDRALRDGKDVAARLSPTQLARAQERVRTWEPRPEGLTEETLRQLSNRR